MHAPCITSRDLHRYKQTWAAIQKLFPNAQVHTPRARLLITRPLTLHSQLQASSFDDFFAAMDKVREKENCIPVP